MDTAGKGGILRHVIGSVDPQGVQLAAFKKPTEEELAHDFLWRVEKQVPPAGQDRGVRPVPLRGRADRAGCARSRRAEEIERRYGAINDFEADVAGRGIRIVKVMLHISKDEQKARLQERLERPDKHWKYNPGDVDERLRWDDYMAAYQRCSTAHRPTSRPGM